MQINPKGVFLSIFLQGFLQITVIMIDKRVFMQTYIIKNSWFYSFLDHALDVILQEKMLKKILYRNSEYRSFIET